MSKKLIGFYKPNLGSPEEIKKSSEEIYRDVMLRVEKMKKKDNKRILSIFRYVLGLIRRER